MKKVLIILLLLCPFLSSCSSTKPDAADFEVKLEKVNEQNEKEDFEDVLYFESGKKQGLAISIETKSDKNLLYHYELYFDDISTKYDFDGTGSSIEHTVESWTPAEDNAADALNLGKHTITVKQFYKEDNKSTLTTEKTIHYEVKEK